MSILKEPLATPSRVRGIFRYLLQAKGQKEKREVLEKLLSPDELVKDAPPGRPMFRKTINQIKTRTVNENINIGLLIEEEDEIAINPSLPEDARNPQIGDKLLPDTLTTLFFASDNADEEDFGLVCAWFLAQDIYDAPGNWEAIQNQVNAQKVGELLKMTNNSLFGQMDDWMCYLGLSWGHALEGQKVIVPDPTLYIKRNLKRIFNEQVGTKILIREFIDKLAEQCPLFETGKFRDEIEINIGRRQLNYLSTSTAFALFRLRDEGYIELKRESDADLMILPKANNRVDSEGQISHIIWQGEKL
ncbi:hypothetical protein DSM106972_014750 [Dulcicalothrix desertica PCC 7102]|uniref:Uncharacterized protein n=1 Tax=Dulcicalothrix desertica PCC 7102 TaxID=232991 RepID=A0A433VQE1_9CYAN|nr:protein DpdG [Dulcicalothrix desertica]RUT08307.1 hypothetical protein DSM106972_014750 [Dulcicalothrix desertica PCC 7102]TWH40173.1 hypothetical protein CAL7102_09475 [Dulcicalothrix desertica PCC 7102]